MNIIILLRIFIIVISNKNTTTYINWRTGTENHKITMQFIF
jgi:hypothetical protein